MELTMFDVGYGDCFLLDVDEAKLIADFGSKTPMVLTAVSADLCARIGVCR